MGQLPRMLYTYESEAGNHENRGRYMERFDEARAGIVLRDAPPIEMIQVASDRRLDRAI